MCGVCSVWEWGWTVCTSEDEEAGEDVERGHAPKEDGPGVRHVHHLLPRRQRVLYRLRQLSTRHVQTQTS
jgi:hypothetical protein